MKSLNTPAWLPLVLSRSEWNPAVDEHLPVKYSIADFEEGKKACKMKLQEELGLPVNAGIPMVAFIGRLDAQKGADILLQVGGGNHE